MFLLFHSLFRAIDHWIQARVIVPEINDRWRDIGNPILRYILVEYSQITWTEFLDFSFYSISLLIVSKCVISLAFFSLHLFWSASSNSTLLISALLLLRWIIIWLSSPWKLSLVICLIFQVSRLDLRCLLTSWFLFLPNIQLILRTWWSFRRNPRMNLFWLCSIISTVLVFNREDDIVIIISLLWNSWGDDSWRIHCCIIHLPSLFQGVWLAPDRHVIDRYGIPTSTIGEIDKLANELIFLVLQIVCIVLIFFINLSDKFSLSRHDILHNFIGLNKFLLPLVILLTCLLHQLINEVL